eukprot:3908398-Amphidinium_carterae.3
MRVLSFQRFRLQHRTMVFSCNAIVMLEIELAEAKVKRRASSDDLGRVPLVADLPAQGFSSTFCECATPMSKRNFSTSVALFQKSLYRLAAGAKCLGCAFSLTRDCCVPKAGHGTAFHTDVLRSSEFTPSQGIIAVTLLCRSCTGQSLGLATRFPKRVFLNEIANAKLSLFQLSTDSLDLQKKNSFACKCRVVNRLAMAPLLLLGHAYSDESAGFGHLRWTFAESSQGDRTRVAGRGVRRQREAEVTFNRVKLVLPRPQWLRQKVLDCGLQVSSATSDCIVLYGLADVEPGQCLEPLSVWSEDLSCFSTCGLVLISGQEATLLWTFLEYPQDLATCLVKQTWKTTAETTVHSRYRVEHGKRPGPHDNVQQLPCDPHMCWPVVDESTMLSCEDGTTVTLADVLCEFAEVLPIRALCLPKVIMELVCAGAWRELPLLGSWRPHLFEEWPPQSWMQDRLYRHSSSTGFWQSIPRQRLLDADTFRVLATEVRHSSSEGDMVQLTRPHAQTMVQWMDDCARELSVPARKANAHLASESIFAAVQASMIMKSADRTAVRSLMSSFIKMSLPTGLQGALLRALDGIEHSTPGRESIRQARLGVDVAHMLHTRRTAKHIQASKFLWWDTTVKKQSDVLLAQMHYVSQDDLPHVWESRAMVLQTQSSSALTNMIGCHSFLPTFIGLRHSALENKFVGHSCRRAQDLCCEVAALMHAVALECADVAALRDWLSGVISVTSDFGTEQGLAEFHTSKLSNVLAPWFNVSEVVTDGDSLQPVSEEQTDDALPAWTQAWLLENAISVPGMLHIVANCLDDVHAHLPSWSLMFETLQVVESLLCYAPRKDRFVALCVLPSPRKWKASCFQRSFKALRTQRWNAAVEFVKEFKNVLPVLRVCWDQQKFMAGHSGTDAQDALSLGFKIFWLQQHVLVVFKAYVASVQTMLGLNNTC